MEGSVEEISVSFELFIASLLISHPSAFTLNSLFKYLISNVISCPVFITWFL